MYPKPNLSPRLLAAAELVREGAFIADVGTDHAYLPIYLCLEGRIRGGVASDINRGPIERAKENIEKYGLSERISTELTDGLCNIEKYSPEDILVLGMGGELIASIIDAAAWTKNPDIRLCLQPMTHAEHLRKYLYENGFTVIDERIVIEGDKIYQVILAQFCGGAPSHESISCAELYLGKKNIERGGNELVSLANALLKKLERRALGLDSAGQDTSEINRLIDEIKEYTENKEV